MTERAFANARLVLPDAVLRGSVLVRGGVIADIADGAAPGDDLDGDLLIPGLVELHTDHLERHYAPRPRVFWDAAASVLAHDAQLATAGITTVFDALRVGFDSESEVGLSDMLKLADAIDAAQAAGRLRAEHVLHLRCEVSAPDCAEGFAAFVDRPSLKMVSLMDHAPGQRQFARLDAYRMYYMEKLKMSAAAFEALCARRVAESETHSPGNRALIAAAAATRGMVLASHDDATLGHVEEAAGLGVRVAEFPTTAEAARASHQAGMAVLMGAPNVMRGGSHTGNVAAADLARAGVLDVLSSDYIPFSLVQAAFALPRLVDGMTLPQAVALASKRPAEAVGLADRGAIEIGRRADLVRVRLDGDLPVVREVWRQGERVA